MAKLNPVADSDRRCSDCRKAAKVYQLPTSDALMYVDACAEHAPGIVDEAMRRASHSDAESLCTGYSD